MRKIIIILPKFVTINIAWTIKDDKRLGIMSSLGDEAIESVNLNRENEMYTQIEILVAPGILQGEFVISCPVTLPLNDPLPGFNFYIVRFQSISNEREFADYPFLGHGLTDTPLNISYIEGIMNTSLNMTKSATRIIQKILLVFTGIVLILL